MKSILLSLAYLASSVFPNAVVGQSATSPPVPAAQIPPPPGETPTATSPIPGIGVSQHGNEIPQGAPIKQSGGAASGQPTLTNEIPTTSFGTEGAWKVPQPVSPAWVSKECQFLGHECVKFEYCEPKYRLRLHGCEDSNVCCNVRKTRSCIKIGGECRKKCRQYEVPNRYVKCTRLLKKCCVAVK
ncbi:uncharacterized protein LOC142578008 [Dermacentor variabilis]|uniref:uncharacterized protein LOC142578008 n=1 Tax=Dermacentor variabilis TaxID=34621 RepID=UPI003F5BB7FC